MEKLKKNKTIKKIGKKINIKKEFNYDKKFFINHYLEKYEECGDREYSLLLWIHNLEKGMCRTDLRPFGKEKASCMISIIKDYKDKNSFAYKLSCATLKEWKKVYADNGWLELLPEDMKDFIDSLPDYDIQAGSKPFNIPEEVLKEGKFDEVLLTRRSVRDFEPYPLKQEDIDFAVKCFIEAPTACNRQMCKVYKIENPEIKTLFNKTVLGVGGLNTDAMTYFIVTYDTAAFLYSGERNQGYLNVGLTAMNFVNGLHSRGIGSCFMQWSNKKKQDIYVRKLLRLKDTERIGVVIGTGYYKDDISIPCSVRKTKDMVYGVI